MRGDKKQERSKGKAQHHTTRINNFIHSAEVRFILYENAHRSQMRFFLQQVIHLYVLYSIIQNEKKLNAHTF